VGTKGATLEYLYRDAHEVGWARGGGEMVEFIELSGKVYVDTDVVFYILEFASLARKGATFWRMPVLRLSMQTTR
jgi:hypothetical protein